MGNKNKSKKSGEQVCKLVPAGRLYLGNDKGQSLELLNHRDEPAVLVDGKYILRRSLLIRYLATLVEKAEREGTTNE